MTNTPGSLGVLLMAYGGPESLAEIEPYLLDVRGGRPTPPELVKEVRERYARIGGRSPLRERTEEQARALERALGSDGRVRTYVGMRHWRPYIQQAFEQIVADRITRVVAMAMAPHYSRMSVGAYMRKVEEVQALLGTEISVTFVKSWHDHPLFLDAVAEKVREARQRLDAAIVFTAHSLPEKILQNGDPYQKEFITSAEGVARLLGLAEWDWAYQSQGSTQDKWLGPDLGSKIDELHARGARQVLVVPIGFVCDHVEVLYDIDIHYREYAAAREMTLTRTASLNASPSFIRALAAIVQEAMAR